MTYAEKFLQRYYADHVQTLVERHRAVNDAIARTFAEMPIKTLVTGQLAWNPETKRWTELPETPSYQGVPLSHFSPLECDDLAAYTEQHAASHYRPSTLGGQGVSLKCAECGLTGNHDTWCPHWQAYVADES